MSPLREVAATTGMGGGPLAAALAAASAACLAVIFAHTRYPPKPSRKRTNIHSHSRRRGAGFAFLGGALAATAATSNAGAGETTMGSCPSGNSSVGLLGVSSIRFLTRSATTLLASKHAARIRPTCWFAPGDAGRHKAHTLEAR